MKWPKRENEQYTFGEIEKKLETELGLPQAMEMTPKGPQNA
jgi:hypothetical protein